MKSTRVQIIVELVAWIIFLTFPFFILSNLQFLFKDGTFNTVFRGVIITHLYLIGFYYFNRYYAIPKFYFQKKFNIYIPIVVCCLTALLLFLQTDPGYNPIFGSQFIFATTVFNFSVIVRFLMIFLLSLGISSYNRLKEAEKQSLKTELSYLKSQINPHFLFNTLNSIYALSVKKSDSAPESITRLSSIMRYVITDGSQEFVPLEKELNYISSYIELEKLRLTNKVELSYTVNGDATGKQIAPLIFIPFIENAFKYGVSTSHPSRIAITISIENNSVFLNVENTKITTHSVQGSSTRMGIENSKKRLGLLYPGKHELKITDENNIFKVQLRLKLT
jgi:LytS/YehU family sensor histidine kinase